MRNTLRLSATLGLLVASSLGAQGHTDALRWRSIGPFRGGRIRAMAGVPSQPYTFYYAQVNGGMWKTTDAGRTWFPIFDRQPTQSIGAIAVAPSDPNTIYVGSGEGLPRPDLSVGDGVYKSTDAGKTWTRLGLNDAQQIPQIAVDPNDPNRLFVAALGHPYGPSRERGIYRSTDGGRTFTAVLQRDENTGGNDVDIDPSNPNVVYANLWEQRQGPWENAAWQGNHGGLFKSTDGGATWKQLTNGLPANVNQVNMAISPVNPNRLFAAVASNGPPPAVGLYRSDDAGETWTKITNDNRPAGRIGGGDLPVPVMHPKDQNTIIMASTVSWKSTDGGATWAPFKGAPGGEDYQNGFINPNDPDIVFLVADQGAVVSLNGGETWSSWYNQPNAMLYHVAADNAFPYRVCSGQQESGSVCIASRGDYGAISDRDWLPVGVDEYGYVAPDPMDPELVYGGRSVTRFDRRTGQVSTVGPLTGRAFTPGQPSQYRQVRTQPVVFSQKDPRALYFGNNVLWKTRDGGLTWKQIAPDLTRKTWAIPASVGTYSDPSLVQQRGVIYTIAPSPLDTNVIWFGTDDGQVFTTANGGKSWQDVTPPQIGPWWKVFMIDAGHFDTKTAYVAVNTLRLDDMSPHFYRTHDGGTTWTELKSSDGMTGPANALREDPVQRGLLFAATEKGVWGSPDDGATWHSMQFNLPRSAVRDLIVKDNDLVVATHGRGFWILDDISPIRHIAANTGSNATALVKPIPALRVRDNMSDDMPWPKEEPVGENPPAGASINYWLQQPATKVTLQVLDARGRAVRIYNSTDSLPFRIPTAANAPYPTYWYAEPRVLPAAQGLQRWFWDVRYQPIPALPGGGGGRFGGGGGGAGLPINSVPGRGTPGPSAPFVAPGNYTVRLIVDGKTLTAPIVVKQDPRVKTAPAAMREVYTLTDSLYWTAKRLRESLEGADSASVAANRGTLGALTSLMMGITAADVPITASQRAAIADALKAANAVIYRRM